MPNHWHFVLWPERDGELTEFLRWLTHTDTQRWHAHHHTTGSGHLYQGRFKAFPIQEDDHFLTAFRCVERNAMRAGLCAQAKLWRWGSLAHRRPAADDPLRALLADGPVPLPRNWAAHVNRPQTDKELEALRRWQVKGVGSRFCFRSHEPHNQNRAKLRSYSPLPRTSGVRGQHPSHHLNRLSETPWHRQRHRFSPRAAPRWPAVNR